MAEHFALQLVVCGKLLALVQLAVQPDKPRDQSTTRISLGVFVVVDKLAIIPCSNDALKFGGQVGFGLRVRLFACK